MDDVHHITASGRKRRKIRWAYALRERTADLIHNLGFLATWRFWRLAVLWLLFFSACFVIIGDLVVLMTRLFFPGAFDGSEVILLDKLLHMLSGMLH